MSMNINPVFASDPLIQWEGGSPLTAANTAKDGTGTLQTIFTAGADGAFFEKAVLQPAGTNVVTVMRFFVNNGLTNATAANNRYIKQVSLAAITNAENAAVQDYEIVFNLRLPAGYKITCCLGTLVASGWYVTGVGSSFTPV